MVKPEAHSGQLDLREGALETSPSFSSFAHHSQLSFHFFITLAVMLSDGTIYVYLPSNLGNHAYNAIICHR